MRTRTTGAPSEPPAGSRPLNGDRSRDRWVRPEALRRSARAVATAVLAIGLAVVASGCSRPAGIVDAGDFASGVISVPAVGEAEAAELIAEPAQVEDRDQLDLQVPVPAESAPAEQASAATDPAVVHEEIVAELRAHLSARTGRRPIEPAPELVAVGFPDAITASEKREAALARPAPEKATLSAAVAVAPTPKPAPKKPVARATPRPAPAKPVVRKPAVSVSRSAVTSSVSGLGQRVVSIAMRYLGYRYRYGGVSPSTGFDCRGFAYYVYLRAGRPIPATLPGQYATGRRVSRAGLSPGDLVFFQNTYKAGLSHVGIYIGNGRMVNAQSESTGVVTASIDSNYWRTRFLGGRRP